MAFPLRAAAFAAAVLACAGGAHAATVTPFVEAYDQLYGLATDGERLYVTGSTGPFRDFGGHFDNGVVGSVSLAKGKLTTLYQVGAYASSSGHVSPFQIAASSKGKLFWADPDAGSATGSAFLTGDRKAAASSQIFNICCGPAVLPGDGTGMALAGGVLYFADATGGRIASMSTAGANVAQIGPTRWDPQFSTESFTQITVSSGKVFIADSGTNRGADGSGRQAIADVSATIAPGVRWISTDGTSGFVDLSVGKIARPIGITAVGGFLYVTSGDSVWKVNKSTGTTKLFVKDERFLDLQGIVYTGGAFYVADSQTTFGPFVNGLATATEEKPGVIWKIVP